MGLPAFIRELRTVKATTTVQSTGEKPSTTRNGMLAPWTRTIDPILPNRRASAGWARMASAVPRLATAKIKFTQARLSANFVSMNTLRNGINWPAPREVRKPGRRSRKKRVRSAITSPKRLPALSLTRSAGGRSLVSR